MNPYMMSSSNKKTVEKFISQKKKESEEFRVVSDIGEMDTKKGKVYTVKYEYVPKKEK